MRRETQPRQAAGKTRALAAAIVAVTPLVASPAEGAIRSWIVFDGNWNTPVNWSTGIVPLANDDAVIVHSDTNSRVITYNYTGPAITLAAVRVSNSGALQSSNAVVQSANSLTTQIMELGTTGRGNYNLSGGFNTVTANLSIGVSAAGRGAYNLSGTGRLTLNNTGSMTIGNLGVGTFNQSGGTFNASGPVRLGIGTTSTGMHMLSDGFFNADGSSGIDVGVSGMGTFLQGGGSAGINRLNLGVNASGQGHYSMSGGDLNIETSAQFTSPEMTVGVNGQGTFTQTGGQVRVGTSDSGAIVLGENAGSTGTYVLSGGTLDGRSVSVGSEGTGHFVQTGGLHTAEFIDVRNGRYDISGNSIIRAAQSLNVSDGSITQSGGVVNVGQRPSFLRPEIFGALGATGRYTLSGGTLNVHGLGLVATLSGPGTGVFEQTGGIHDASGLFFIGDLDGLVPGATGTYLLSAGRLHVQPAAVDIFGAPSTSLAGLQLDTGGTIVGGASDGVFSGKLTMKGGTIAGTFRNEGTIHHLSGSITGTLLNRGTLTLGGETLPASATITNESTAVINGAGTLSGGVANRGHIAPSGDMTITSISNGDVGSISIATAASLRPVFIDNFGRINLSGGALLGTGTVSNNASGVLGGAVISGGGTIGLNLVQNGGILRADNPAIPLTVTGTIVTTDPTSQIVVAPSSRLNLNAALSNPAIVSLQGGGAQLVGATITNTGTLRGAGQIGNQIINNGILRAEDGSLILANPNSANLPAGQIQTGPHAVRFTQGLQNNLGLISLSGGEFDNGAGSLTNGGRIIGRGTLRAGTITNSGTMSFSGGVSDVFAPVNNSNRINITGSGAVSFYEAVNTSVGTINVNLGSTATFFASVTGLDHFTGAGIKEFEANAVGGGINTGNGATVVGPGGNLVAGFIRDGELSVVGRATIAPNGTPASTSRVNTLIIDGETNNWNGRLDLTNNALVIDYEGPSPIATIANQIKSGHAGGAWTGNGIATSSGNASQFALGYAESAAMFSTFPANFMGQSVDNTALLIRFTRYGDANLDGVVNLADFNRLAANFGGSGRHWRDGDFNYDGLVNLADFNRLAANFGLSAGPEGPSPEDWSALASAVPEPVSMGCILGLAPLLARRRRDQRPAARSNSSLIGVTILRISSSTSIGVSVASTRATFCIE